MSKKVLDNKNRWRSKTVGFRVSPEEWQEIERLVRLSGMSKQDYIMHRLQNKEMTINANPRVVKALRKELETISRQLEESHFGECSSTIEKLKYLLEYIKNVSA